MIKTYLDYWKNFFDTPDWKRPMLPSFCLLFSVMLTIGMVIFITVSFVQWKITLQDVRAIVAFVSILFALLTLPVILKLK